MPRCSIVVIPTHPWRLGAALVPAVREPLKVGIAASGNPFFFLFALPRFCPCFVTLANAFKCLDPCTGEWKPSLESCLRPRWCDGDLLLLSCAGWVEVGVVPHMSAAKPGTSMLLLHGRPGGRPGLWRTYSWASCGQVSPENCGAWDAYIEIFCGRNRAVACDGTESRRSVAGGSRLFLAGSRDCDIGSRSLCQLTDRTCEVCCFNSFFAHMMSRR